MKNEIQYAGVWLRSSHLHSEGLCCWDLLNEDGRQSTTHEYFFIKSHCLQNNIVAHKTLSNPATLAFLELYNTADSFWWEYQCAKMAMAHPCRSCKSEFHQGKWRYPVCLLGACFRVVPNRLTLCVIHCIGWWIAAILQSPLIYCRSNGHILQLTELDVYCSSYAKFANVPPHMLTGLTQFISVSRTQTINQPPA